MSPGCNFGFNFEMFSVRFGPGFCIDAKKEVTLGNLQIFVLFDIWGSKLALKIELR